ncbi:hypothetical protein M9H77_18796 [Catharanthus roseus]|uniref:Uncharacterized protein n=1 Tax=Catharanthus roseus TaxID=4058 RepID=A0ACC0B8I1_CATRO|nr:hypothetical protein M9H77_18796 [Catharanthus roseus]
MLIACKHKAKIDDLKSFLKSEFDMKDLGFRAGQSRANPDCPFGLVDWLEPTAEEEDQEEIFCNRNRKRKVTQGLIQIENPNLVKPKNLKANDVEIEKTSELSRLDRGDRKQKAHERYMRLQEQGKTEQARKDFDTCILVPNILSMCPVKVKMQPFGRASVAKLISNSEN